jgi:ABC-type glycerol-3-phosphate transport system substrate-binding protein
MSGPGRAVWMLGALALLSGAWAALRPADRPADLTVWVFAEANARKYRDTLIPEFERRTGRSVRVELINARALESRLQSMLMSGNSGELPDVVELEIGAVARFFRPPPDRIGLLPLEARLAKLDPQPNLPPASVATWSKGGHVFGVPLRVHPVAIVYRADLWADAGLDPRTARTWDEFESLARRYVALRGEAAIELSVSSVDSLVMLLLQRGINLIDETGQSRLASPVVADTLATYARWLRPPHPIGRATTPGPGNYVRDLRLGRVGAMLAPDWRFEEILRYAPDLADRLRLMPLPVFDDRDAPTSTWGGTMMGIPRGVRDPDAAFALLSFLSLRPESRTPAPDPIFDELSARVPRRIVTPATAAAQIELASVLRLAIDHADAPDLESRCRTWLHEADARLARTLEFAEP